MSVIMSCMKCAHTAWVLYYKVTSTAAQTTLHTSTPAFLKVWGAPQVLQVGRMESEENCFFFFWSFRFADKAHSQWIP